MQHRQHSAALARQLAQAIEELDLVAQVEEARRLVEQEERRLLRQRAREEDALPLAARERADGAVGEGAGAGALERGAGDGEVALRLEGDPAEVRMAAEQGDLERGEGQLVRGLLRHHGDAAGALARRERGELVAQQAHRAARGAQRSREQPHQGRLAGAVRTEQADDLAAPDREADAGDPAAARVAEDEVAPLEERRPFRHRAPAAAAARGRRDRRRAR